jgi:hypothetical protein
MGRQKRAEMIDRIVDRGKIAGGRRNQFLGTDPLAADPLRIPAGLRRGEEMVSGNAHGTATVRSITRTASAIPRVGAS